MIESQLPTEPRLPPEGFWERFNHPVFGVFTSAWIIWNWEIIYTLLHGGTNPQATINLISTTYLIKPRLDHLFWGPLAISLGYLITGPLLKYIYVSYKTAVETLGQYTNAKIRGWQPVHQWELNEMKRQKRYADEERGSYRSAYDSIQSPNKTVNVNGGAMDLQQLITFYNQVQRENQELRNENARLKAEILNKDTDSKKN